MKSLLLSIWIFALFLVPQAFAYFGDPDTDKVSLNLSIAGQNADQTTSATALVPLDTINGWVGLYLARQIADKEVIGEVFNLHLQGGYDFGHFNLEGYIEGYRDLQREISGALGSGYFIRPEKASWNGVLFSFGLGNYTEQRDNDEEIGRDKADTENRLGWLSFVSGTYTVGTGHLSAVLRYKPALDFDTTTWEGSGAINFDLNDEWSLGISGKGVVEEEFNSSYLIGVTYMPE